MTPEMVLLILRVLDLLAFGLRHAPEMVAEVQTLNAKVREMVEQNRDPSPEEWADLEARLERARHALGSQ